MKKDFNMKRDKVPIPYTLSEILELGEKVEFPKRISNFWR